jgi:hypothetical protein
VLTDAELVVLASEAGFTDAAVRNDRGGQRLTGSAQP